RRHASHARIIILYVVDYIILGCLAGAWGYISTLDPNFSRFSLTDITIQYPIADPETVTYAFAIVYAVAVPIFIIMVWSLVIDWVRYKSPVRARLWELNAGVLGILLSLVLSIVITTTLKAIVGRPRPDAIARCIPKDGATDASPYGLSTIDICTQTDHSILAEGWRSWPSGHSSTSFAGLLYLSLYLAGKLSLYDNKGEVWKSIVVMIPSLGAAAIATSRVKDHRHHGTDVLTGSIIGAATAWLAYRLYYPPLSDTTQQGRAWSMRRWGEAKVSPPITNGSDG
ncbi:phosphatidic acid phosphatase type 2/haloperoxidase, partial [Limtongia smithiae]|uniref:phosphatidic acid phosphatase type 2/haloperoxidase n=1 Tax=Limtongia smithiae TaxID=1125753 RepID=UPI0034CE5BDB